MTVSSRRSALRIGGATLASFSLSGCLGIRRRLFGSDASPDVEWVRSRDYSHIDSGVALTRAPDGGFALLVQTSTVETDETRIRTA